MGGPMIGWTWLWLLLVVLGLLLIGYVAVRLARGGVARPATASRERQILDERFAQGEIDEQDYRRRRDGLP